MVLDEDRFEEIKKNIGKIKTAKAQQLVINNKVKIEGIDLNWNYETATITATVIESASKKSNVNIRLNLQNTNMIHAYNCSCQPYSYKVCEHIVAVLLQFNNNPKYIKMITEAIQKEHKEQEKREFKHIISNFKDEVCPLETSSIYEEEYMPVLSTNIDIVPIIKKNKYNNYELSFKIGENKMYKIKSIEEFYRNYSNKNIYKYGNNLALKHIEDNFSRNSRAYLQFILKYGQAISYANIALENRRGYTISSIPSSSLLLEGDVLDDFFNILKNKPNVIELDGKKEVLNFMKREGNIKFNLEEVNEEEYKLSLNKEEIKILKGINTIYTIINNNVYEYDKKKYSNTFDLISEFESRQKFEFNFEKEELIDFVNNILPTIRENVSLDNLSDEFIQAYIPKKLAIKVYLDVTNKGDVLATIKFCYDDIEFEPYSNKIPQIPRDIFSEKEVLKRFMYDGFSYDRNYESFIMKEEDKIYNFITNCIEYYMENYEVLISEEFKKKEIRQPKISALGVKIQNNLLNIDLSGLDFDPKELQNILAKYKLKKKYHRLKNGEFLSLDQNEDLDFIEDLTEGMEVDYNSLAKGKIKIPVNRSLYLNKLLNNMKNTDITADKNFKEIIINTENGKIDEEIVIPKELEATLRTYQKTGCKWLKVLEKYGFGGILADDMGLRKNFTSDNSYIRKYQRRGRKETFNSSITKFINFKLEK